MKILENVDIKPYSSFKIGGKFKYFVEVREKEELIEVCEFAKEKQLSLFILGGGSNVIFSDGVINKIALKINILGFEYLNEDNQFIEIKVGAGENWDKFVEKTVNLNLSGLECLSAIPGTVGATPVQNVGAYGSEIKDTLVKVEVYDIRDKVFNEILNKDCKFGYRDSIFKDEDKGRYIITSVVFRLSKSNPILSNYPGVTKYFDEREISNPSIRQIRDAIIHIRSEKLPNPKNIPNVGSFFKNPIVPNQISEKIKEEFSNAKFFPIDDKQTKIPAGWLIENAGLKGKSFGSVSVYDKNALVLINNGNATKDDVINTRNKIIESVEKRFGIKLEQEPEII